MACNRLCFVWHALNTHFLHLVACWLYACICMKPKAIFNPSSGNACSPLHAYSFESIFFVVFFCFFAFLIHASYSLTNAVFLVYQFRFFLFSVEFTPTPLLGTRFWHPIMWIDPPEPPKPKKKKTKTEIDEEGNEVIIELSEDESSEDEEEKVICLMHFKAFDIIIYPCMLYSITPYHYYR